MTAFARGFTQTSTGFPVLQDPDNEPTWAHWAAIFELETEAWTLVNDASTGFRRNLQTYVNWSRNGALSGAGSDLVFSSSILPQVEPLVEIEDDIWVPLSFAGFYWTDNNGAGGSPSNYTFHEAAFHLYTFHQLSRVTTIIRIEGDFNEPPFGRLRGKRLKLGALGVAA